MIRYTPGCETRKRLDGIAFLCEFRIDVRPCQVSERLPGRPVFPRELGKGGIIQL